jgi:hypothetical protein
VPFFAFSLSLSLSVFSATHETKKLQKKSSLTLRHKKNIIMFASSQSLVQHHQRFSSPALSTSRARNNSGSKKRATNAVAVVGAFFFDIFCALSLFAVSHRVSRYPEREIHP